jgi:hypothetical protein
LTGVIDSKTTENEVYNYFRELIGDRRANIGFKELSRASAYCFF